MSDSELNAPKEMIFSVWPSTIHQLPVPLKPYWPSCDELAVEDGIAMKSHHIMIPTVQQKEILTKLHAVHQGTEKTRLRARMSIYGRGLNKDIDEIAKTCSTCQELHPCQQKEPLILTEVPPWTWHTIETDLFTLEGSEHLVVADYYSKYPFFKQTPRGQSNSHYSGQAFQDFARKLGFQDMTSSPH